MAKWGKTAAAEPAASGWRSRIVDRGTADPRDLLPHPMNHRQHPVSQRDHLRAAIREVGFVRSVTVNRTTGHVLDGHLRLDLALEDKEPLIDVEWVELSEAEERLVLASMDQITAGAEIDPVKLDALLQEVQASEPDLQRLLAGMATDAGLYLTDDPPEIEEDEAPEPPADPITRPGDLWILGNHRLLCGDSTKAEDVGRLMGGERADMVFTDPPYNCADEMSESFYANANSPAMKGLAAAAWDKGFDPDRFLSILGEVRPENGTVYVCTSHMLAPRIWECLQSDGATHCSYVVWCKPNPMPSLAKRHPTWATELICYATYGKHVFNFPPSGHSLSWWEISKNSRNDLHPTQKPVAVPAKAIGLSSKSGDKILDLFSGSGTTIIAAEQLDRRCYAMEISPAYCDVAVKRWEKLTGKVAERVPASEPVTEHANG